MHLFHSCDFTIDFKEVEIKNEILSKSPFIY